MVKKFQILWLLLFSIPALSPLLTPTLTRSADGVLHLYRLVQLDALWRNGIFFSRWLPDLAFGYGMPVFNYYAPLVYYLTTSVHWFGLPFTLALNLSLAAAMFVGAVGIFYLTRALLATQNGTGSISFLAPFVAALAYLYSPYLLFNALYRGNLAEQWALALAPLALWRFFVLVQGPTALNASLAVLSFAAVVLSHNVTGFVSAPLLFFFTLAAVIALPTRQSPISTFASPFSLLAPRFSLRASRFSFPVSRFPLSIVHCPLFILAASFFLALALSAFFWLPALLERDFVQIARVIVTPDFDYRFNFVPPLELISLLPRADTGRMNPAFPSTLGVIQIVAAVPGILFLVMRFRSRRTVPMLVLLVAGLGFSALMLAFSQPLWDTISLLSFVQLPMRLRGFVALSLAPFAGLFILGLPVRWRMSGAMVVISALVLSALPVLYPRYAREVPPNPRLTDMFAYEQRTGALGTTSFGEYLPVWVESPPDTSPFEDAYARNEIPDRIVLPEGVQVCGNVIYPTAQILCASSQDAWHLIYRAFYFPGWVARVQGTIVPITPTPRTGLISFQVANGDAISVQYVGTDVEHIVEWISIAAGVIVLGIFAFGRFVSRASSTSDIDHPTNRLLDQLTIRPTDHASSFILHRRCSFRNRNTHRIIPHPSSFPLLFLALALIALKLGYVDRLSNPFVAHFDGTHIDGISQPLESRYGEEIQLLGVDVNSQEFKRGETLRARLYWRALPAMRTNLSTFVHLTAPDGFVLAQQDSLHPANLPTTQWDLDAYAVDEHTFDIPPTVAPGIYQLRAGVYDPRNNIRLRNSNGGDYILLASIRVRQ